MNRVNSITAALLPVLVLHLLAGCCGDDHSDDHSPANQPPTATIRTPGDGETYVQGETVSFLGTATDPEDGGLTGESLVWTATPGGIIGAGRSFARDDLSVGTHTITLTATDSQAASTSDSVTIEITPPNQPPTATIEQPSDGATFVQGRVITFSGSAADPEDGDLTGDSLVWTATTSGAIGTGQLFTRDDLSVGTHTITLTATDSDGASASDSITIEVTPPNQPPTVTIHNPTDGASFFRTCPVTFEGSASDLEDGQLTDGSLVWSSSLDGQIGLGELLSRDDLSLGTHTITLTAVDSLGASASDSVGIEIASRHTYSYLVKTDSSGNLEWEKIFTHLGYGSGFSVQQTADGGLVVAGDTRQPDSRNADLYLVKTDFSGNIEWERTFGGPYWDTAYSVQQTTDGGYILAGEYRHSDDIFPPFHAYLVKTDSSGNLQWERIFSGTDNNTAFSVRQSTDGGYVLAGTIFIPHSNQNVYVVKTDPSGNTEWENIYGTDTIGVSVDLATGGGYVVAGWAYHGCYLMKTDSSGELEWEKTYGEQGYFGASVQRTLDAGYIVAGTTFFRGLFYPGACEAYLVKTDSQGNAEWQTEFGSTGYDRLYSVQQTSDSGYVVAGAAGFSDPDTGDVYLAKTDSSGNVEWERTFGSTGLDIGYSARQMTDGGYVVIGWIAAPCTGVGAADPTILLPENRQQFKEASGIGRTSPRMRIDR